MSRPGIKGIIRYFQDHEPDNQEIGDIWFDTKWNRCKIWDGFNWIRTWNVGLYTSYGYCCGGNSGNRFSTIDRVTFPFDSGTAIHVGNLSGSRDGTASCNSSNYGYCMGGNDGSNFLSTIDRITFPFDSGTASHAGNLSGSRGHIAGCNSSNYGYCMGGWIGSHISIIDRITFPFDSGTSSHVGNLSTNRYGLSTCNSSNYGYAMSGHESSVYPTTIDRIEFPFDSGTASHVGDLTQNQEFAAGFNSSEYGFCCGGHYINSSTMRSTISRLQFPFNSGTASYVGNLSGSRDAVSGCNSTSHGFVMGGGMLNGTGYYSIVERLTFPFDSGSTSVVGSLSGSRRFTAGVDGTDFVALFA